MTQRRFKFHWKRGIIALGISMAFGLAWVIYSAIREGADISRTPIAEYNNLFSREMQAKLQHPFTYKSKIRQPESNYNVDSNFHLTVYKLILTKQAPLRDILAIKNVYSSKGFNVTSGYADNSEFTMDRISKSVGPVSKINLIYQGTIKEITNNDSIACYYLKLRNFSLSDDDDSIDDIWGEAGSKPVAMNIAFVKNQQYLYVILLFRTNNESQVFPENMLYKMFKNYGSGK